MLRNKLIVPGVGFVEAACSFCALVQTSRPAHLMLSGIGTGEQRQGIIDGSRNATLQHSGVDGTM